MGVGKSAAVAAIIGSLIVAGCGGRSPYYSPTSSAPPSRRAAPPRAVARAVSPAAYVAAAGAIDLFEIQSSELAMERATMQRTRDFAQTMIRDHKGTSSQLSLAGRRLNLLPSATLDARHQAMLDQLSSASDLDAAYKRQQSVIIGESLTLHSAYAARGTSPTLRPVAAAILPVIQRHQRLLRYL
jgi:predicted outer membrane protein